MSSVKTILGSVGAFLAHHVADLKAVGDGLTALLNATPVNAGTRAEITKVIQQIENSAMNISAFLSSVTDAPDVPNVTINESDLEKAVSGKVTELVSEQLSTDAVSDMIANAVSEYMATHPVVAPDAEPAEEPEETSAKKTTKK